MIPLAGITMQKPPVVVGSPLKMLIAHQHHRSDDHRDCQKKNCYMYCLPCAIATSSRYLWSSTSTTTMQCDELKKHLLLLAFCITIIPGFAVSPVSAGNFESMGRIKLSD